MDDFHKPLEVYGHGSWYVCTLNHTTRVAYVEFSSTLILDYLV